MANAGPLPFGLSGWKLERRAIVTRKAALFSRVVAILLALLLGALALELQGKSSLRIVGAALASTLGTSFGIQQALILATPITLTGLAVVLSMRMGVWNIGVEGQLFMGAYAAAAVGLFVPGPPAAILALMVAAGAVGGAAWVVLPALARAYANINEIISTLMLNFVAVLFVRHFVTGPWRDLQLHEVFATPRIAAALPTLGESRLHVGFLVPLLIAAGMELWFRYTRMGYEVRMTGANRRTAEFAGIPVVRHIVVVMCASAAIAGLAGMIEVAGTAHRLTGVISNGYGFLGFLIAVLANNSPLPMVLAGVLVAVLLNAGISLQVQGLSIHIVLALTGLILLFAAIGDVAARYRFVRRRSYCKIAVVERHTGSGRVSLGVLEGLPLRRGAIAASVGHDSHNITVVGTNSRDMAVCVNKLAETGGGYVAASRGRVIALTALPVAGLVSEERFEVVARKLKRFERVIQRRLGFPKDMMFLMIAGFVFQGTPFRVAITDKGIIDVDGQAILPSILDDGSEPPSGKRVA
jgi:simple sugar transport system permease protein